MKCPRCNYEMKRYEPEITGLVPIKVGYKCSECKTAVEIMKAYSAADNDVVVIIPYPEQKDATK